jgi:hypothetical protein
MGVSGIRKEMLFVLGQFFKATDRRFAKTPLSVSVSKAEFIDVVRGLSAVAKKERAIYRNLEDLEKNKLILYDANGLKMSRKGYNEYKRMLTELKQFRHIARSIKAKKIQFKRKTQTKLTKLIKLVRK